MKTEWFWIRCSFEHSPLYSVDTTSEYAIIRKPLVATLSQSLQSRCCYLLVFSFELGFSERLFSFCIVMENISGTQKFWFNL